MDGTGGVRVASIMEAAPNLNTGGGFSMAARERARNGSVTRMVAMVMYCCCGQESTFLEEGVGVVQDRSDCDAEQNRVGSNNKEVGGGQ